MKAAIYSRKSKFTGKGESVENQIQLCKQYGQANLNIVDYIIYEDEGFSGKNTDRPEFQRMLKDARSKKFDTIICYRLDRISRNIGDFSKLIEELSKLGIGFVSIKEQFDTSSPMGRAMMYISSVFAQLERETIAERVRDNMLELSKTGRWLGGPAPLGFTSIKVIEDGKEVAYLEPVELELETVKLLYDKYMELGSLFKVNKYMLSYDIKGRSWTAAKIGEILKNPVYVKSNQYVKDYAEIQGITVIGETNNNGLVAFNKTDGNRKAKDKSEWIYAVGRHEGIIDASTWIKIQRKLSYNKTRKRAGDSHVTLLTGLLKCSVCGSPMTTLYGVKRKDGTRDYYYRCTLKTTTGKVKCNNPNADAMKLEDSIIKKLILISTDFDTWEQEQKTYEEVAATSSGEKQIQKIKKAITKNETQIQNLVKQLSILSPEASEYVITELDRLSKENVELKAQVLELEDKKETNNISELNKVLQRENIKNFPAAIKQAKTLEEKKILINRVVKCIYWDGVCQDANIELIEVG